MKKKRKTPEGKPLWQVLMEEDAKADEHRKRLERIVYRREWDWINGLRKKPFDNTPEKSE